MALPGRRSGWKQSRKETDPDRLSLRHLEAGGANLTRARHVIHVLDFDEESDARAAIPAIEHAGWEVTLAAPTPEIEHWRIRAEGVRVVDRTTVGAFRSWFERVAAEQHGTYDGWEASAKP